MPALTLFPEKKNCKSCGGRGWSPASKGKRKICPVCKGTGKSPHIRKKKNVCDKCHGTGRYTYTSEHWTADRKFTRLSLKSADRTGKTDNVHTVACDECKGTGKV